MLITWLYETWKVHTYPPKVEQVTLTIFIVGFAYLVDKVVPGPRTADKMKDPRFFLLSCQVILTKFYEKQITNKVERAGEISEKIHIGMVVKQELRRQGRSNRWFAEQLNVNLRTVNKIFDKQYIDTQQLFRICKILGVDFFKFYSDNL